MAKLAARIVAIGLSTMCIPACLVVPPMALQDGTPAGAPNNTVPSAAVQTTAQPSPQAPSVVAAPTTVRRVAPNPPQQPAQPLQYVTLPSDKVLYDQFGRPVSTVGVDFASIPPGTQVLAPQLMPNVAQPTQPPTTPPHQQTNQQDAVEVVAVTHTLEPPLAPVEMPRVKPQMAKQKAEPIAAPLPQPPAAPQATASAPPPFVPPGAQVLILQPQNNQPGVHTASHNSPGNDAVPNLLTPPIPAEELRLVSVPKTINEMTPLMAAVKALQNKNAPEAERQLAKLDPVNRDVLGRLLPLAVKFGDTGLPAADPAEIAELVDQLQNIMCSLRTRAALRIEKLSYCRTPVKAVRYGGYQPLPEDHPFHNGETVELYMELRNFSCEAKEKQYMTHISTVIEVRDERNELVNRFEFERDQPESGQAARQDYFHICRFPLQGMAPADYTLTALVTDVPTGKSATKTMKLRVEPARRVARGTAQ